MLSGAATGRCGVCNESSKIRTRQLSDTAIATLIAMGEIEMSAATSPMCDACFGEIRETLIEVSTENLPQSRRPVPSTARRGAGEGRDLVEAEPQDADVEQAS